jgi:hypothetical protein
MVLMPNGKIYQCGWTVIDSLLSVIDSPDVKGLGCDFHLRSVLVPNSLEIINVPNFPNYNLGPLVGSGCDTLNTGVANVPKQELIKVMPNPTDGYLQVSIEKHNNYILYLLNELGQVLDTKQASTTTTFTTQQLANGLYFIRVIDKTTGAEVATKKVVVVH